MGTADVDPVVATLTGPVVRAGEARRLWVGLVVDAVGDAGMEVDAGTFGPVATGPTGDLGGWVFSTRTAVHAADMDRAELALMRAVRRIALVDEFGEELDEDEVDDQVVMPWDAFGPRVLADRASRDGSGVAGWVSSRSPAAWEFGYELGEGWYPWIQVRALQITVEELRRAEAGAVRVWPVLP